MPTFVSATKGGGVASSSTLTFSFNIAAGANSVIVVEPEIRDTADAATISSVTYAAAALSLVSGAQGHDATFGTRVEDWVRAAPSTGSNNVVITLSSTPDRHFFAGVRQYDDINQSTPTSGGTGAAQEGTTTPTLAVSSATGDLAIAALYQFDNINATPGQTERWQYPFDGTFNGVGSGTEAAGAATVTFTWTVTNNLFAVTAGFSLKAPAAGAVSPPTFVNRMLPFLAM